MSSAVVVRDLDIREGISRLHSWFASRHEWSPPEENCPGCGRHKSLHVAGGCYVPQNIPTRDGSLVPVMGWDVCGWSVLGEGNAYGFPAGWTKDAARQYEWLTQWYRPGEAWWEDVPAHAKVVSR